MKKLIAILLLAFTVGLGFAAKADYYVEKYSLLDQQQQYQEIINDITQKDESEFTTSDYFYLGLAYFRMEKDEEALKYFNIVIQNDPSFSSSYYYIGGIYLYSKEYAKAIPYYENALNWMTRIPNPTSGLEPYMIPSATIKRPWNIIPNSTHLTKRIPMPSTIWLTPCTC